MTCLCILYAETRRSEKIQGLSTTFQQIFEFMVYNFSGLRKVGDVLQFYSTKKKKRQQRYKWNNAENVVEYR